MGLCQPEWRLFAPNVHKTNSYLSAEVMLANGETRHWSSPDFGDRSLREKFAQGQLPKLYDNLRLRSKSRRLEPVCGVGGARSSTDRSGALGAPRSSLLRNPAALGLTLVRSHRPGAQSIRAHVFYERRF